MRPLKAKEFISETAQQTGLPDYVVKDIINYYWEAVRKSLSSLKHSRVHLENLGTFSIKYWKLDDKIEMLEKFEESNRQKGLQQMTARFRTAETLYDLRQVKVMMEQEKQREDFIKLHKRAAYESKGKCNTDMEVQGTDPGRDQE